MTIDEIFFCFSLVLICAVLLIMQWQIRDLERQVDEAHKMAAYAIAKRKGHHND